MDLLLGFLAVASCIAVAGNSLGSLIGPVLLLAMLPRQPIAFAGGIAIGWLWLPLHHAVGWGDCFSAMLILLSFAAALQMSLCWLPQAIVAVATLLWLTWPVWASPWIGAQSVRWPVRLHPLLSLNGICRSLGNWTEQRYAYHLTNLGQDVTYNLPSTPWPSALFHLGLAAAMRMIHHSNVAASKTGPSVQARR